MQHVITMSTVQTQYSTESVEYDTVCTHSKNDTVGIICMIVVSLYCTNECDQYPDHSRHCQNMHEELLLTQDRKQLSLVISRQSCFNSYLE